MKLDIDKKLFTNELRILRELFAKNGYQLRLAGGPVRDLLLDVVPDDLDFATTATPDQMIEMFEKEGIRMLNKNGEKHGTVTCRLNDTVNYEVTTLRIDQKTDGRHADVEFTTDWKKDASRRDLTINSLFLDLDGTVYDYFCGVEDLKERRIRFVGNAADRIQEDFLRILRYFRFCCRFFLETDRDRNHLIEMIVGSNTNVVSFDDGIRVDERFDVEAVQAVSAHASGLSRISGERIWVELKKMLAGNRLLPVVLRQMFVCNVFGFVGLDERPDFAEVDRLYRECRQLVPPPALWLATLCSDLRIRERLKISNDEKLSVQFILVFKERLAGLTDFDRCLLEVKRLFFSGGHEAFGKVDLTPTVRRKRCEELLIYLNKRKVLEAFRNWKPPEFPVSGRDLLDADFVDNKRLFSAVLKVLKCRWVESEWQLTKDDLLKLGPAILDELKRSQPTMAGKKRHRLSNSN